MLENLMFDIDVGDSKKCVFICNSNFLMSLKNVALILFVMEPKRLLNQTSLCLNCKAVTSSERLKRRKF